MRIGFLGSRGIPNNYGGYEQFAGICLWDWLKKIMKFMFTSQNSMPKVDAITCLLSYQSLYPTKIERVGTGIKS